MAKDHSGNIFEEAARFGKPKEPITKMTQVPSSSSSSSDLSDVDLEKMMQKASQMKKEIDKNIADSLAQAGVDIKRLHDFVGNPNNFTQEQWQRFEQKKKQVEAKLKQLIKGDIALQDLKLAAAEPQPKSAGRKAQSLGAKKKNWMPIK